MGLCTTPYKMLLFCVQTIVSGSCYIKLAHLKKERKKKEKYLAPVGVLLVMKALEVGCHQGLQHLGDFERIFLYYHILHVHAIATYRVYQPCDCKYR